MACRTMAHASSSRETLDGGLTLSSIYSHADRGLGGLGDSSSDRRIQIDSVEGELLQQHELDDYDSDGFVTPPLPPDWGLDASQSTDADSSYYFSSHATTHAPATTTSEITSVTATVGMATTTIYSSPSISPSIVDSLFDPGAPTDIETEYDRSQGTNQMEDGDYNDLPSTSSIDSNMDTKPFKRRGRPLGSMNKKKKKTTFITIKQEEISEDEKRPFASTPIKSILKRVDGGTGNRVNSRDPTLERTVEFDLLENEEQIEDEFDQQQEEEKEEEEEPILLDQVPPELPSLHPDFVFEPPDESMFQNLREFLEQQEESNRERDVSDEEEYGAHISDEAYERRILRKLKANREILSKLGLGAMSTNSTSNNSAINSSDAEEEKEEEEVTILNSPHGSKHGGKRKVHKSQRTIKIDADGTTTSLPLLGYTMEVSHVDVPLLRPRIRLQHMYYDDVPIFPPMPMVVGSESEEEEEEEETSRRSPVKERKRKASLTVRKSSVTVTKRAPNGEAVDGAGTCCHQCRRKTTEPKMRCRYHEGGRVCSLFFCKRCLDIRYGIEFDEESRTFECPRCMAYCNCSLCLHRAGLARFVPNSINSGLGLHLCDAEGNKMFKSVRHYIEAKVGRAIKIGPGGIPGVGRIVGKSSTIQGKDADSQVDVQTTKKRRASTEKGKKVTKRARKAKETSVSQEKKGKHKKGGPRHSTSHLSNTEDEEDSIGESSGGGSRPNSNQPTVSSTGRKIKLTFKARNSMEEYTVMKEGSSGTRIRAIKPVSQVLESVAKATARATKASTLGRTRGRRPKSITTTPLQVIDSGNIWVKSKADEAAPSSSDDEMMEDMDPYEASSTESDDGAGQDDMEERESEAESVTPSNRNSPEAGQIEFSYPHTTQAPQAAPQLTMTGYSMASNPSPFQSGEVFLQEMEEDAFPFHSAPDLALIMNQLRSAGYV